MPVQTKSSCGRVIDSRIMSSFIYGFADIPVTHFLLQYPLVRSTPCGPTKCSEGNPHIYSGSHAVKIVGPALRVSVARLTSVGRCRVTGAKKKVRADAS